MNTDQHNKRLHPGRRALISAAAALAIAALGSQQSAHLLDAAQRCLTSSLREDFPCHFDQQLWARR